MANTWQNYISVLYFNNLCLCMLSVSRARWKTLVFPFLFTHESLSQCQKESSSLNEEWMYDTVSPNFLLVCLVQCPPCCKILSRVEIILVQTKNLEEFSTCLKTVAKAYKILAVIHNILAALKIINASVHREPPYSHVYTIYINMYVYL